MNNRIIQTILCLLFIVVAVLSPSKVSNANLGNEVYIPDIELKKAINYHLGNEDILAPVTKEQIATLINLENYYSVNNENGIVYVKVKIKDLTGLEHATNLRWLDIPDGGVTDLSPISELPLTRINLSGHEISDLKPISDMKDIYSLNLSNNHILDLSHLPTHPLYVDHLDFSHQTISFTNSPGEQFSIPVVSVDGSLISISPDKNISWDKLTNNATLVASPGCGSWNETMNIGEVEVVFSGAFTSRSSEEWEQTVSLPDLEIEKIVRESAFTEGISNGNDPVTIEHMAKIGDLFFKYINREEATKLNGIEYATNLQKIDTWTNGSVRDISPLRDLSSLRYAIFFYEKLEDFASLENCKNLTVLSAINNQIKDLDGISKLQNLESLILRNEIADLPYANKITSVEPLNKLDNLKNLDISGNQVEDITPLSGLLQLETMRASKNQIKLIIDSIDLPNLKELNLRGNQITDVQGLNTLTQLVDLDLSSNQMDDVSALSKMLELTELRLADNQIESIKPLQSLKNLRHLSLSNNRISDLQPLSEMKNLRNLFLGNNRISDVSPINAIVDLLWNQDFRDQNISLEIPKDEWIDNPIVGFRDIVVPLEATSSIHYDLETNRLILLSTNGETKWHQHLVNILDHPVENNINFSGTLRFKEKTDHGDTDLVLDINSDGQVNIRDVEAFYLHVINITKLDFSANRLDYNQDKSTNIKDVQKLYLHVLGIEKIQ